MAWLLARTSDDDHRRGDVPAEVFSYVAWCSSRGVEAYPVIPSAPADLDRCYGQQRAWEDERQAWQARHPFTVVGQPDSEELPRDFWDPREQ